MRVNCRNAAASLTLVAQLVLPAHLVAETPAELGTEEFGLTTKQLVEYAERVEDLIAACMRRQGFEYIAVDYLTVRRGMSADKSIPGLEEEEFIQRYGFGISTLYTGGAPQLNQGYSPAREGLGERNTAIFRGLSPSDQAAYTRALCGEDASATFAVGLETENFSRCGGCTREAVAQVFDDSQLQVNYYNPVDAMINEDPRMKKALREYSEAMREAGFDYDHPDEVETDVRDRLNVITNNGSIPVDALSPERRAALSKLKEYELRAAVLDFDLAEELFDPIEAKIQKELFSREVK